MIHVQFIHSDVYRSRLTGRVSAKRSQEDRNPDTEKCLVAEGP